MRRRLSTVPAVDRGGFIPGLKPRGHEDVLFATTRELLATLPAHAEDGPADVALDTSACLEPGALEPDDSDRDVVRAFLHRQGHGRQR